MSLITEKQKRIYLQRTNVVYKTGGENGVNWHIFANFIGGVSVVDCTIESAIANYTIAVSGEFNNPSIDWDLLLKASQ